MKYRNILLPLFISTVLMACSAPQEDGYFKQGHVQRMLIGVPEPLICDKNDPDAVDLDNAREVAKVLGVRLNGDPKQHLYDIVMKAPTSEGVQTRTIPIRVDNIEKGRRFIESSQQNL